MSLTKILELMPDLIKAFNETMYMVGISLTIAILLGIPLGILLFVTDKGLFFENRLVNLLLGTLANIVRSVPFIILLVALLPLTQFLIGTTIGPTAASVPLSVAAVPFYARLVESSLREINKGVIEAAISTGATPWLIIREVLLPEARPGIIAGLTITAISLLGFSAMAGIVGGGGIGDLAIRFGYYRYENEIMLLTVFVLIALVQIIQYLGDWTRSKVDKR
ncbi:methionine ABC transporter permease [Effusibacillus lacus]|uniref:Methionine ABC transporter permease n=1 Tax=Effusibacillus lacus TaxID=1348429 RepID=A0A292YEK0_9BACL|nr:methionine ABC transporter permease [Effusibacillus lacus]TCS75938.1 D-methionine transport system permease protein [Effusibacillus lacus]GAX91672.1 methionine ABC transporter permease [Effusibacillus lacus]